MTQHPFGRLGFQSEQGRRVMVKSVLARLWSDRPDVRYLALFYAAYVFAGGFGQGLAIIPGVAITFWPPAGIFVATLLLTGRPSWPWWFMAGCLAELTCNAIWFHNPVPFALIYFAANALEALAAAWLINWWLDRPFRLDTLEEVAAFIVLGAGVAPIVGATVIATTDAILGKHAFMTAWPLVWLGDGTGLLVSTPLALVAAQGWRERANIPLSRLIEVLALIVVLIGISALAFKDYLPTAFMTLPPLLWMAARFRLKGAAVGVALVAVMEALFAMTGRGELASQPELLAQRIVMLQTFLGISAISALVVAALSLQHRQTLAALRDTNRELEKRVAERTAKFRESERQLTAVFDALPIGVALVDASGRTIVGNEVYKSYIPELIPSHDDARRDLWEGYGADGHRIERHGDPGARALRGERMWPGIEFLYHGDEKRGPVWTRVAALPFSDENGEVTGATVVIDDIDQEKRGRDALRTSEERFLGVFRQSPAGILETDATGRMTLVNQRWCEMLGYEEADLLKMKVLDVTHESSRAATLQALNKLAAGGPDFQMEKNYLRKDGSILPAQSNVSAQRASDGRFLGIVAVVLDMSERLHADEQRQLLMREVNHRSKNMLSLVLAIARQTSASDPEDFVNRFQDRVHALALSQDLLVNSGWTGVSLEALVKSQLAHFKDLVGKRIVIEGLQLVINASAAQALGMALHELATNAGKYGALSNQKGKVRITWDLIKKSGDQYFVISWIERGGPKVAAPRRRGFGTNVIEKMSKLSLDADVTFNLAREGLSWHLECPAGRVLERGRASVKFSQLPPSDVQVDTWPVLIVEDEALIAHEIASELERAGFTIAGPVASVAQAIQLIDQKACGAAVLDINLGRETSEPIARRLIKDNIPFVTISGYSPDQRPAVFENAPFFSKPLNHQQLAEVLKNRMSKPTTVA